MLLMFLPDTIRNARIPKPIPTRLGGTITEFGGSQYALFPFVRGDPADTSNLRLVLEAGRTLAGYHSLVYEYLPMPRQRITYGSLDNLDWVCRHVGGQARLVKRLEHTLSRNPHGLEILANLDLVFHETRAVHARLAMPEYSELPKLVVHNDFGPQNITCEEDKVIGLLDFDYVLWDVRMVDLAAALIWVDAYRTARPGSPLGSSALPFDLSKSVAFVTGYLMDVFPPLQASEVEFLPWLMRAYVVALALWHLDLSTTGKRWFPNDTLATLQWLGQLREKAEGYVAAILKAI